MKKDKCFSIKAMMVLGMLFAGTFLLPNQTANAAAPTPPPVKVAAVIYSDESIYVVNNGNSRIYYATEVEAAKENWEPVEIDSTRATMIDFSWLSPSTENILMIKGEENATQSRVIIKERPRKLEVSINYEYMNRLAPSESIASIVNIMTSEGNGEFPVDFYDLEWKKGTGGQWMSTENLTVGVLEKYLIKGTYLYFRIKAVDDVVKYTMDNPSGFVKRSVGAYALIPDTSIRLDDFNGGVFVEYVGVITFTSDFPNGTRGRRSSNEIKVKIAKKSSPMVYGIDGEEFTAAIKYAKEYRVTSFIDGDDVTTDWIPVINRAVKTLP
ncbi:MAG: hypothetical protein ACYDEX_11385, partial [Mobilitalea sp.]